MNLWRKFKTFLKRPGNYFRYKKKFLRYLYFLFSKYLHFRTYLSRVGPKKFINSNYQNFEFIDDKEGFKLIKASKLTKEKCDELLYHYVHGGQNPNRLRAVADV